MADTNRDSATELFVDDRGAALRASWSAERGTLVVSMWRDGRCIGTHALAPTDAARLSALVTQALIDTLHASSPAS